MREPTIRYLHEREQPTAVYIERMVPITLESGDRVSALTFVADRMHRQYAGRLAREAMLERVRAGAGASGDNAAYVTETCDHLLAIGVRDRDLEWLTLCAHLPRLETTQKLLDYADALVSRTSSH